MPHLQTLPSIQDGTVICPHYSCSCTSCHLSLLGGRGPTRSAQVEQWTISWCFTRCVISVYTVLSLKFHMVCDFSVQCCTWNFTRCMICAHSFVPERKCNTFEHDLDAFFLFSSSLLLLVMPEPWWAPWCRWPSTAISACFRTPQESHQQLLHRHG